MVDGPTLEDAGEGVGNEQSRTANFLAESESRMNEAIDRLEKQAEGRISELVDVVKALVNARGDRPNEVKRNDVKSDRIGGRLPLFRPGGDIPLDEWMFR